MVKQDLSTHLRQYYEAQAPSAAKLAQLVELAKIADTKAGQPGTAQTKHITGAPPRDLRSTLVLVFALVAMIALFFFLPPRDVTQSVAKEIVLNHHKGLAVEFPSESYAELGLRMSKLDFSLVHSKKMDAQGLRVVGGRYCSIQGDLAAQIKLQDAAGRIYTLYQSALTDDLIKLKTGVRQQDGLKLLLWREAGLFFGLAGPMD